MHSYDYAYEIVKNHHCGSTRNPHLIMHLNFQNVILVEFNYACDYAYKIVKSSLWKHQESTFNYAYDYAFKFSKHHFGSI